MTIDINQQQIQDVKTSYQTFGLNKAVRQIPGAGEKKGKFAVEEFEQVGTVNGKPAHDFDIETLEDKPWRKPGKNKSEQDINVVTFCTFSYSLFTNSYIFGSDSDALVTYTMHFIHLAV